MTKIGTFKIETTFNVTSRGIVAVGQIIEGIPKIGTYLALKILENREMIKIIGTERGNPDENDIVRFGLLLSISDPARVKFIAENKLQEQVADLYKD